MESGIKQYEVNSSMDDKNISCPCLYLVVPCYNEEEIIGGSANVLMDKLERLVTAGEIKGNSKVMFVDDGSTDSTPRYTD